eukprot:jgi/Mesvir1/26542/Mv16197-RA.1
MAARQTSGETREDALTPDVLPPGFGTSCPCPVHHKVSGGSAANREPRLSSSFFFGGVEFPDLGSFTKMVLSATCLKSPEMVRASAEIWHKAEACRLLSMREERLLIDVRIREKEKSIEADTAQAKLVEAELAMAAIRKTPEERRAKDNKRKRDWRASLSTVALEALREKDRERKRALRTGFQRSA